MSTIHKYPIRITDEQRLELPINAEILHVGLDPRGTPCLWVTVNRLAFETFKIYVVGTGRPIPDGARKHIGSFVQDVFVWHVFTQ